MAECASRSPVAEGADLSHTQERRGQRPQLQSPRSINIGCNAIWDVRRWTFGAHRAPLQIIFRAPDVIGPLRSPHRAAIAGKAKSSGVCPPDNSVP
jgi:hypothetical protein